MAAVDGGPTVRREPEGGPPPEGSAAQDAGDAALRPGDFCRLLLSAMSASDGRRRKRKRDTTPDALGMGLKRDLLERAAAADPAPAAFETWLLEQVLTAPASGAVRAMCAEILDEYRVSLADPSFATWLAAGAFSEDAGGSGRDERDVGDDARQDRGPRAGRGAGWCEDQYARESRR